MATLGCPPLCIFCLLCIVLTPRVLQVHGQSQTGFISIDCGIPDGSGYQDASTKINFSPDAPYVDGGENKEVSAAGQISQFKTLRSFPSGTRNCYRLRPVKPGGKYQVRAGFWYGNYDGQNRLPRFDLHIGVNFWATVSFASVRQAIYEDIITVAPADSLWVCLVNTGKGTPFISTLELRPFLDSMYTPANPSQSLVLIQDRTNYGSNIAQVRYPDDPYDRIWFGYQEGIDTMVSARAGLMPKAKPDDGFQVPSAVLTTAFTTSVPNVSYGISQGPVPGRPGEGVYVVMHFAEIQEFLPNETRRMDIYEGDGTGRGPLLYGVYSPRFLVSETRDAAGVVGGKGTYTLPSIYPSASSTLPPIINALEVFALRQMDNLTTDSYGVEAMEDIKRVYKMKRNWMGDPCAPKEFVWDGVNCSYESSKNPRIIYLNLTSSGLSSGIPASIANLTALTTLDLSYNYLMGSIPDFLAQLPSLKILNLAGNKLSGVIPRDLCEEVQNAAFFLRTDGNIEPCPQVAKKKKTFILVIVVASLAILLLLVVSILLWRIKKRSQFGASSDLPETQRAGNDGLKREGQLFTFAEIVRITKNFEITIGKGGFGTVYLGYLEDGTQVAVKVLSQSSFQGTKQFQTEAVLLTRVHHKNLVSLLGYCNEEQKLALVYEYMDQGTLHDHLSGKIENTNVLTWEQRVMIALQTAQGLDYLHNGCKPLIIHRDVKSANILLNHKFVAKLADFGLSRAFDNESLSHLSTAVVGTLGYLDPEYYETYRLNEKSDVYSFGIVLLEIITGRPALSNFPEKMHILKWVQSRVKCGDIASIVDSSLCGSYDANSIWKVLEIAIACTSSTSAQRLTMSNVVTQLKECLAPEVACGISMNFGMPNWNSIDTLPLNINLEVPVPSAR